MLLRFMSVVVAGVLVLGSALDSRGQEVQAPPKLELKVFKLQTITAPEASAAVQTLNSMKRPTQTTFAAIAVDQRAHSLFARGTAEQISEIELFLKAIDLPVEKLTEAKLPAVDLLPVKLVDVRQVQGILNQLQIRTQVVTIGNQGGVVLVGNEDAHAAAEVRQVLKSLDVADATVSATASNDN